MVYALWSRGFVQEDPDKVYLVCVDVPCVIRNGEVVYTPGDSGVERPVVDQVIRISFDVTQDADFALRRNTIRQALP